MDYLIQRHNETGFPQKFQATYSKNNPDTVFVLNKKLNEAGMSKGATLSFQSMSEDVLAKIYRKNMPLDNFKRLMRLYNENGIAAYSELILGLPGETYESFREGLELLLENGQHMSINIFNCELLNNSIMNDPAYIEAYGIRTARIEQHQYHIVPYKVGVQEYSNIVVSTSAMPPDKWIDSNILGIFVRAFHNLGLLQCFAIYLFYEKNIPYMTFYEDLIEWAKNNPETTVGRIYSWLYGRFEEILQSKGALTWQDDAFGPLTWPFEESVFLMTIKEEKKYREEIILFAEGFFEDKELFADLLRYQHAVLKRPGIVKENYTFSYDWFAYFSQVYDNKHIQLEKKRNRIEIDPGFIASGLPEYAKQIIWFGRKGNKNVITSIRYI